MKSLKVVFGLILLGSLLLAACTPAASPGDETPEEPAAAGTEKTVFVGPELVDCVGVAPQECLQVKESPEAEYTLFYGNIEGFDFEPGYEYELRILETEIENPPADASSIQWTLIEVVSKTAVETGSPTTDVLDGTGWVVESMVNGAGAVVMPLPGTTISAEFSEGQIGGSASCNRYFASYTVDGSTLTFSQAGSTMMFCNDPEGVMEQESAYLANLEKVASFVMEGDSLSLLDGDGNPVVVFTRATAPSLTGVVWELASYNNGREAVVSVLAGSSITAEFTPEGLLSGSAGCNRYTTGFTLDGELISIEPPASTLMACNEPEGVMEQEALYLQALPTAETYGFVEGRLELRTADGALVASYDAQAAGSAGLENSSWQLDGFMIGGDAFASPLAGTTITASFLTEGRLSGSAGCNQYTTSYELDGELLSIGPAASTRMFCSEPEGVMEQEANYLQTLEKAASYQITGDQLTLLDADGLQLLVFNRSVGEGEPIDTGSAVVDERLALLLNGAYPDELAPDGIAQLVDGEFRAPAAEGAAAETVIRLVGEPVYLTLPGGEEAALVTLASNGGGSGTFISLHLVSIQDGAFTPLAATLLGDRVIVNQVDWVDEQVVVDLVTQGPADAMCCPTLNMLARYDYVDGSFQKAGAEELGTVAEDVIPLLGVNWQWLETQTAVELISVANPENYTLRFLPGGRYLVQADCNFGSGTYTLQEGSIEFGPAALTMMACPEGSQDSQFLQQLSFARILFFDEQGDLRMDLFADGGTMHFQAAR
jgi:heat shock protein HslJ